MKSLRSVFKMRCLIKTLTRVLFDIGLVLCCYLGVLFSYYKVFRIKPEDPWNVSHKVYMPPSPIPFVDTNNSNSAKDEITLVTAFFDLGTLQKGDNSKNLKFHNREKYKEWMNNIAKLNNHIVLYVDDYEIGMHFARLRGIYKISPKRTHVVNIRRKGLWAFQISPKIKKIFSQNGFPKYHPNTVNENYCSVKHSKYQLIERSLSFCKTKYIGWIDVGYFDEKQKKDVKTLKFIPENIRSNHIVFQQIGEFNSTLQPRDVIYQNKVWVSGSLFFGRREYMSVFIEDYKRVVNTLITQHGIISSDEQVLYIMFLKHANMKPRVPIQTLYHACKCDHYYIGKLLMGNLKGRTV